MVAGVTVAARVTVGRGSDRGREGDHCRADIASQWRLSTPRRNEWSPGPSEQFLGQKLQGLFAAFPTVRCVSGVRPGNWADHDFVRAKARGQGS